MAYSKNPNLPGVRMRAVILVRQGWSIRKTARYLGFHHTAVIRWLRKAPTDGRLIIPTKSSRPHFHPDSLKSETIDAIIKQRKKNNRCAEVVHQELINQGITVSLSSVKRILRRYGLLKQRSPWKKYHQSLPRPEILKPGDLIQVDTIHIGPYDENRLFVYTLIDVLSRWAWANPSLKINAHRSSKFVDFAQNNALFGFQTIQSDHGGEFSTYFTEKMRLKGLNHRHIRIRKPIDNSHLERFNRTLQEECLNRIPQTLKSYRKTIPEYLHYYNNERLHLGLKYKTPLQVVTSY
jgi:transposase InsO family protein